MLNVGKLYQVKQYFWLLYPSKETALVARPGTASSAAVVTARMAAAGCGYWGRRLNCNVSYIPENSIFCLLEKDEKYLKVLPTNGEIGWILYPEREAWAKVCVEEVNQC